MLYLVTLTGADGSVDPKKLIELSKKYPFVEWGILVSGKRFGTNRFPALEWLLRLSDLVHLYPETKVNLACHLCGQYVRDLLVGNTAEMEEKLKDVWEIFQRVQINTHGEPHPYNPSFFEFVNRTKKEFILQYDGANHHLLADSLRVSRRVTTLYDMSHGAGTLPSQWPQSHYLVKNGYAGGLGPDNVEQELHRIASVAGNNDFWIDMETKVRSNSDELFDLEKCREVLDLMVPFAKL
jgi:hypothetical protein